MLQLPIYPELKAFHEIEIVFKANYEVAYESDIICNLIRLRTCLVMLHATDINNLKLS